MAELKRRDSTFKRDSFIQASTSTFLSCFSCGKMGCISMIGKIKKAIIEGVNRWIPKEKLHEVKKDMSPCIEEKWAITNK